MQKIAPEHISVVIQGPLYRQLEVDRGIEACIASIRQHLPGAQVVVSTWVGEDISGLDADIIIQSDDPGYMRDCSGNILNTNRQLVSTREGLKAATRPYAMKFRADHNLLSADLAQIGEYQSKPAHGHLFDKPVTITTLYVRNPLCYPMIYHASDLVSFGQRSDMLKIWDKELFAYEELFNAKPNLNPMGNFIGYSAIRHNPEQAFIVSLLHRQGIKAELEHPCQVNAADLALWDDVLSSDFNVINWDEAGVDFPKRFLSTRISMSTVYTANEIRALAALTPGGRRRRWVRVWLNQYVLNCLRPAWWVSSISIMLFALSPNLAKSARNCWRWTQNTKHPNPEKNGG